MKNYRRFNAKFVYICVEIYWYLGNKNNAERGKIGEKSKKIKHKLLIFNYLLESLYDNKGRF